VQQREHDFVVEAAHSPLARGTQPKL
jgi:hypothetical protein